LLNPSDANLTTADKFWAEAIAIVQAAPRVGSNLELEERLSLVLLLLEFDLSNENYVEAYRSALNGEPLEWLIERLRHRLVI
jgi:hypothetical protein